jgi:hypothetical protein
MKTRHFVVAAVDSSWAISPVITDTAKRAIRVTRSVTVVAGIDIRVEGDPRGSRIRVGGLGHGDHVLAPISRRTIVGRKELPFTPGADQKLHESFAGTGLLEREQILCGKIVATPSPSHEGSDGFLRNPGPKELEHIGDGWSGIGRSAKPTIDSLYGEALEILRSQHVERH